jgi:hypothetical protein
VPWQSQRLQIALERHRVAVTGTRFPAGSKGLPRGIKAPEGLFSRPGLSSPIADDGAETNGVPTFNGWLILETITHANDPSIPRPAAA